MKNHKSPSVGLDSPPKRRKMSKFSQLTSDPTSEQLAILHLSHRFGILP